MINFNVTIANKTNTKQITRNIKAEGITEMKVKARDIALNEGLETIWDNVQIINFTRDDNKALYSK